MEKTTIYKKASTGKITSWSIWTEGADICTQWGYIDGQQQTGRDTVLEGKNIGRANQTTPEEQADAEARSTLEKKLKRGYVKTLEAAKAGEVDKVVGGGIWPMLAQKYADQAAKIQFPAFMQPKLDGHRCIAVFDKAGKCTLWTRTRKPILTVPHIVAALDSAGLSDIVLDGELYADRFSDDFEKLTHLIKRDKVAEGHEKVQYHVYDCLHPDSPSEGFSERLKRFNGHLKTVGHPVVCVETTEVGCDEEVQAYFKKQLAAGYEGAMIRNASGAYVQHPTKRSYDLQKIKQMDDAEFKIVGVKEGRGKLAGHGIFTCATEEGNEFDAKMSGSLDKLKEVLENKEDYIGKMATIQYQGMTKKSCVPRFPVALRVRDDL
jgi:DNA ligase-1